MLKYCFKELKLNRVEAQHEVDNPASGAVMRHAGMRHEGTLRKRIYNKGEFRDMELYADPEGGIPCACVKPVKGRRRCCFCACSRCSAFRLRGQAAAYDKALAVFGEGRLRGRRRRRLQSSAIILQAETYAAYAQGLTFYEQGNYTAAEPYFEQTRGFMYGEQRYRLLPCRRAGGGRAVHGEAAAMVRERWASLRTRPQRAAYCRARARHGERGLRNRADRLSGRGRVLPTRRPGWTR